MIESFRGDNAFLSNFVKTGVFFEGAEYPSVEHAFQAAKTLVARLRQPFMVGYGSLNAGQAKREGRKLPLRHDWEAVKVGVMRDCLRSKFEQGSPLAQRLIATGDQILVEGNDWHDNFWGDCRCGARTDCAAPGENMLGRLLMRRRRELAVAAILLHDPGACLDGCDGDYLEPCSGQEHWCPTCDTYIADGIARILRYGVVS